VLPGTPDLIHQLGGLEKDSFTGKVSYDPKNHQTISELRRQKIDLIKNFLPAPKVFGDSHGDILLIGFGGTFGPLRQACLDLIQQQKRVSHLHIDLLNPLHDDIGEIVRNFKHIIVAEHNQGQLQKLLRAQFLIQTSGLNKIMGKPFLVEEITTHVTNFLRSTNDN
jgi:2-oxoglutarate ferredoxin oxidoreductase subunit alpha